MSKKQKDCPGMIISVVLHPLFDDGKDGILTVKRGQNQAIRRTMDNKWIHSIRPYYSDYPKWTDVTQILPPLPGEKKLIIIDMSNPKTQ